MQEARIELLQRSPVFGGIRADVLHFLLGVCPVVSVHTNEFFFREHDQADSMFVLEVGKVAVVKSWCGKEYFLRTLKEGDCFGEMAIMDLCPRSASARAIEDCTAIRLSAANLYQVYEQDLRQFCADPNEHGPGSLPTAPGIGSPIVWREIWAGRGHRARFPGRLKMLRAVYSRL